MDLFRPCVNVAAALLPFPRLRALQFLDLCLLVGCDYITASIKGLGIATAHKLVDRHRKLDKVSFSLTRMDTDAKRTCICCFICYSIREVRLSIVVFRCFRGVQWVGCTILLISGASAECTIFRDRAGSWSNNALEPATNLSAFRLVFASELYVARIS